MAYKLIYSAQLVQVDQAGNPAGDSYSFGGKQMIGSANPQQADLTAAVNAMAADILAQINTGTAADPSFAQQQTTDTTQD